MRETTELRDLTSRNIRVYKETIWYAMIKIRVIFSYSKLPYKIAVLSTSVSGFVFICQPRHLCPDESTKTISKPV